jgi:hypothetical protein
MLFCWILIQSSYHVTIDVTFVAHHVVDLLISSTEASMSKHSSTKWCLPIVANVEVAPELEVGIFTVPVLVSLY